MNFTKYKEKFKISKRTDDQLCADLIYEHFKKKIAYGRIMSMLKTHGRQAITEIFNEVRKAECDDELKLFIWRVGQNKVNWQ